MPAISALLWTGVEGFYESRRTEGVRVGDERESPSEKDHSHIPAIRHLLWTLRH